MRYEPWMLAAIDQAGLNGIREEHIEAVARELLCAGLTEVSWEDFAAACRHCGVSPERFTQEDLDRLQERLTA